LFFFLTCEATGSPAAPAPMITRCFDMLSINLFMLFKVKDKKMYKLCRLSNKIYIIIDY